MAQGQEDNSIRDGFTVINIVLIILGLGSFGVGLWMNAEKDVRAYLLVFGANPSGNMLIAATILLMLGGLVLVGAAILGLLGTKKHNLLGLYILLIIFGMIFEFIAGFMALAFHQQIFSSTLSNMQAQIANDYEWANSVGKAWNRVQVRRRCCGAESAEDYRCSDWWYGQPENAGYGCPSNYYNAPFHVPDSCCILEMNQDRDPEHVNPQEPIPKNRDRCNEDAAGNMWSGSSNVHGRGCYTALQDLVFTHIFIIMGIGIGIALFQAATLTLAIMQRRNIASNKN